MRWRPWGPYTEKVTDIKTYGLLSPDYMYDWFNNSRYAYTQPLEVGRVPHPSRRTLRQRISVLCLRVGP